MGTVNNDIDKTLIRNKINSSTPAMHSPDSMLTLARKYWSLWQRQSATAVLCGHGWASGSYGRRSVVAGGTAGD